MLLDLQKEIEKPFGTSFEINNRFSLKIITDFLTVIFFVIGAVSHGNVSPDATDSTESVNAITTIDPPAEFL